jgi:hypothetical protein
MPVFYYPITVCISVVFKEVRRPGRMQYKSSREYFCGLN